MTTTPWPSGLHNELKAADATPALSVVVGELPLTHKVTRCVFREHEQSIPRCTAEITIADPDQVHLDLDITKAVKGVIRSGWNGQMEVLFNSGYLTSSEQRTDEDGQQFLDLRIDGPESMVIDQRWWGPSWSIAPHRWAQNRAYVLTDPGIERPGDAWWPAIDVGAGLSWTANPVALELSTLIETTSVWAYLQQIADLTGGHIYGPPRVTTLDRPALRIAGWDEPGAPLRPAVGTGPTGYISTVERHRDLASYASSVILTFEWQKWETIDGVPTWVTKNVQGTARRLDQTISKTLEVRRPIPVANQMAADAQAAQIAARTRMRSDRVQLHGRSAPWIRAGDTLQTSHPGLFASYRVAGIEHDLIAGTMTVDLRRPYTTT